MKKYLLSVVLFVNRIWRRSLEYYDTILSATSVDQVVEGTKNSTKFFLWQPSQSLIWDQCTTSFGATGTLVLDFGHIWFSMDCNLPLDGTTLCNFSKKKGDFLQGYILLLFFILSQVLVLDVPRSPRTGAVRCCYRAVTCFIRRAWRRLKSSRWVRGAIYVQCAGPTIRRKSCEKNFSDFFGPV